MCFGRNLNGVLMNGMECHVNWTVCFVDLFVNVCVNWYMLKGEGEGEGEGEVRDRKQKTYILIEMRERQRQQASTQDTSQV